MNDTEDAVTDVTWLHERANEALAAIAALYENATKAILGEWPSSAGVEAEPSS